MLMRLKGNISLSEKNNPNALLFVVVGNNIVCKSQTFSVDKLYDFEFHVSITIKCPAGFKNL